MAAKPQQQLLLPGGKNPMIKIGIECENLEDLKSRWGVGQVTFNLLKEYANNPEWQSKYKLYLYFKKRVPDDEFLKNSIFVKRVSGSSSFNIFYHILMPLRAMFDRLDWMFFPAYMLPPLYLGKSVVMLTDDVYHEYKYGNLPFRYKLAYRLFTNWAAIKANKILAISETSKKKLVKLYGIKPEKIFVSHLGVNYPQKSCYSLLTTNYLLYVGQMFPRRHARENILAFKKVVKEFLPIHDVEHHNRGSSILHSNQDDLSKIGTDLKLIMVGKDKYPGRAGRPYVIKELITQTNKELGSERIIHHDYIEKREDINRLYAGARALIYVSDREAFGLPPVEALSFGVSPVIMDNELGHELFEDYAFYSKSGDIDDIAEAMSLALSEEDHSAELRARIKNSGSIFAKKYNWKNFAEKFFEEIK